MRVRLRESFPFWAALLLLSAIPASATDTISGTVTNGTSGKPAAGADVILLKLSQGMEEETRTRTDAHGHFELPVTSPEATHLLRVVHQKVNYHRPAPPGTTSVEVQVFDSAARLEGISTVVDIMRVQGQSGSLQVTEMFAVRNESKPPRTLMSDRTFEIFLPEGARIDSSIAAGPGGMPVNSAPVPAEKGRYFFVFPLRPGETRFQVNYHLPYSGEAEFTPRLAYKVEDFAVVLPKSMQFTAQGSNFKLADEQAGTIVQMAKNVGPGAVPGFRVAGMGVIPEEAQGGRPEAAAQGAAANRPGGGMGRPSELPDPLRPYRWYILGGLAGVLALAAVWFVNRQPQAATVPIQTRSAGFSPPVGGRAGRSMLLDALKEEIFQLETERLQQKISPEEYQKTKAALDLTLQRALNRKN